MRIFLPLIMFLFCMPSFSQEKTPAEDNTGELQKLIEKAENGDAIIRLAPKTYHIKSVTIPAELRLDFAPKSRIFLDEDSVLTLNGALTAGTQQIFEGPGKISGHPKIQRVYPQWFGALGDDRNDDGPALQKAAGLAAVSEGKLLFIPQGRYRFEVPLRISSNVECHGVLVSIQIIDYEKKHDKWFLDWYPVKNYAMLRIIPDEAAINLDPEYFYGIKENSFRLPHYREIPAEGNPGNRIELQSGGTLTFQSTDFFSARNVLKQDHVYEKTDICQIVSQLGDVFPEFSFSYGKKEDSEEWSPEKVYKRGDYVKRDGKIYKASYPSGPGVKHSNKYYGEVTLGTIDPSRNAFRKFKYPNGREETMMVWRLIKMQVSYTPPQLPLEIKGLQIEVQAKKPLSEYMLVQGHVFRCERSNVTFNRLSVLCRERFMRISSLAASSNCTNLVFNNSMVSGANSQGSGYNILNTNVANITYNNCISVNARDGMAGRHAKNITINGGHYNVIDDHYGKGYLITGVTFHCIQPWIDGFYTPKNDPQNWYYRSGNAAVAFGGSDITIENCRVFGGEQLLCSRSDIGDFYGNITIRNVSIVSEKPFTVLTAGYNANFDYAHKVKFPSKVVVENVSINPEQSLNFNIYHWSERWPVVIRNCCDIGKVTASRVNMTFSECEFKKADFQVVNDALLNFHDCIFKEKTTGLKAAFIGHANDNLAIEGAKLPFQEKSRKPETNSE